MTPNNPPDLDKQAEIQRLSRVLDRAEKQIRGTAQVVRWCWRAVNLINSTHMTHAQKEGVLLLVQMELERCNAHEYHRPDDDIPF